MQIAEAVKIKFKRQKNDLGAWYHDFLTIVKA
jgi:hypothetical protein